MSDRRNGWIIIESVFCFYPKERNRQFHIQEDKDNITLIFCLYMFPVQPMLYRFIYRTGVRVLFLFIHSYMAFGDACSLVNSRTSLTLSLFNLMLNSGAYRYCICMKNKSTAVILAIIFGGLGIHHFYLGNTKNGLIYIIVWLLFFLDGICSCYTLDNRTY